jgi:hypothetical protein
VPFLTSETADDHEVCSYICVYLSHETQVFSLRLEYNLCIRIRLQAVQAHGTFSLDHSQIIISLRNSNKLFMWRFQTFQWDVEVARYAYDAFFVCFKPSAHSIDASVDETIVSRYACLCFSTEKWMYLWLIGYGEVEKSYFATIRRRRSTSISCIPANSFWSTYTNIEFV